MSEGPHEREFLALMGATTLFIVWNIPRIVDLIISLGGG